MIQDTQDTKLDWWWGRDEERYHGPCASRVEAVMEAWSDDPWADAYIVQAAHGELNCDLFDGARLADEFDEANYEAADGDGDPLSQSVKGDGWDKLAALMNRMVKAFARDEKITPWNFEVMGTVEHVPIASMAILAAGGKPAELESVAWDLISKLENVSYTFDHYGRLHRAKATPEDDEKAAENEAKASRLRGDAEYARKRLEEITNEPAAA